MTATRQECDLVRLHVPDDLAADLVLGLSPGQAHYLRNVMRLASGADLALFNGRDGEWRARIDGIGKGWCSLVVRDQLRPQAEESDVWLVFAPVKRARLDFIAQHATELGVAALWPVFTRHTAVSRVNVDRIRANAVEAAEQCERLTVPEVFEPVPLDQAMAQWPTERCAFLCDESGSARPAAELFAGCAGAPAAVLCGPEGGFAASELDGLRKLPFVTPVALGPRVLRAETAAIAALACWQALAGDWHRSG
ncbi:MAG: 16S rRNA (uracil(1498)-N(3))-methyltransferase [Alphaproteobacteria bacterium]|nr:16S rRNA (uracil(1498)-N(3))-methyltransferase [Alphaproteobacteria bacterium]